MDTRAVHFNLSVAPAIFNYSCENNGTLNEQERERHERGKIWRGNMSHYLTTGSWALGYMYAPNYTLPTIASTQVVPFELDNQSVPMLEKIK